MTIPRGFTRCDECEGYGLLDVERDEGGLQIGAQEEFCPSCSGSGLVPTEKLREEAAVALYEGGDRHGTPTVPLADAGDHFRGWIQHQADAVLAKVAEHLTRENN